MNELDHSDLDNNDKLHSMIPDIIIPYLVFYQVSLHLIYNSPNTAFVDVGYPIISSTDH